MLERLKDGTIHKCLTSVSGYRPFRHSRRISPVHGFQLVMCLIVFSRNRNTCFKECNFSFMYRKSPTNDTKSTDFTSTINSKECQPTYQETRALGFQGCTKSQYRYTVLTQLHWILAANRVGKYRDIFKNIKNILYFRYIYPIFILFL